MAACVVVLATAGAFVAATAPPSAALTILIVDSAADPAVATPTNCTTPVPGACTLRDAIAAANLTADDVQIDIPAGLGPITLTTGNELAYTGTNALTLRGVGGTATIAQAGGTQRVINDTSTAMLTVQSLTITGGRATGAGVVGGGISAAGPVTVTGSTITDNQAIGTGTIRGGGIHADGSVTVTGSTIGSNVAGGGTAISSFGGGISSGSAVVVASSTVTTNLVSGSSAAGGGIFALTAVTVTDTTIEGNSATGFTSGTGAGFNSGGTATVNNSTITGNAATGGSDRGIGGGLISAGVTAVTNSTVANNVANGVGVANGLGGGIAGGFPLTVTRSTISGNSARSLGTSAGIGGGIFGDDPVTLVNSTLTNNTASGPGGSRGGGVFNSRSPVTLVYSTVLANIAPTGANVVGLQGQLTSLRSFASVLAVPLGGGTNCALLASTTSLGFNFTDDGSCGFPAEDLYASDPLLAPLASYGGPTNTRLPLAGSPLIDGVPNGSCQTDGAAGITTDQRGFVRPGVLGGACDIGAVELASERRVSFTG